MVIFRTGKFFLLLFTLLCFSTAWGQPQSGQDKVSVFLSRQSIAMDETAVLTISIGAIDDTVEFDPPNLSGGGLRFRPAGTRRSYTNIQGVASSAVEYDYVVEPLKPGRHLIPAISGSVGGQAFETQTLRLEVLDSKTKTPPITGYQPPSPGGWNQRGSLPWQRPGGLWRNRPRAKPFELETELESSEFFKHQVIPYSLRLVFRQEFYSKDEFFYISPTGFLSLNVPIETGFLTREGKQVDSRTATTLLFGLTEGTYDLPALDIPISASRYSNPIILRAQPKILTIKPLPNEGKPKSFTGAVGQKFEVNAFLRREEIKAGQTVELTVTVKGDGHLDLVPYPYLPDWNGVERRQTSSPSTIAVNQGKVDSRRTYNFRLKVTKPGTYQLKDIGLSFFNPEEERYETVKAAPLVLTVEPNEEGEVSETVPSSSQKAKTPYRKVPGKTSLQSPHLSLPHLLLALGLSGLGILLSLLGGGKFSGFQLGRKSRWKSRPHKRPQDLLADLVDIAPGSDAQQRQKQLAALGLSPEKAREYEELRRRVQEAEYGHSASQLKLEQASRDLQNIMRGSKS